ncbi:MAG TPA: tripartite tricarboxylate transporter substrate binding protein [Pseudorhizobium sp.]|jgi:tripartite-type tricarboxylate transporter receptor subunit TctC|nr:tripartite tricarboxylate transporter substrate binding protein [Pseudorhizobium sp.]
MLKHLMAVAASLTALTVATAGARAKFPERPITIVVPFSAGGNTDTIARITADHLQKTLGQPVVVENRGGGGGSVGAQLVAEAEADGYTLIFGTTGSHSVNPNLRDVGYDPMADFTPISTAVVSSVLIAISPDVEATTLEDLIALTTTPEGSDMNFGSGGVGTVAHVAGELYNQRTGSSLVHIPYKGAGDVMNDLVAGRLQVYMNNVPVFLPHIASDAVRPLAVAAAKRSALLPDIPTTAEAGLDDFVLGSWFGLLGPAGIPEEAVDKLHAAMATLDDDDAVVEKFAAIGVEPMPSESPEAFTEEMKDQLAWWGEILKDPAFQQ